MTNKKISDPQQATPSQPATSPSPKTSPLSEATVEKAHPSSAPQGVDQALNNLAVDAKATDKQDNASIKGEAFAQSVDPLLESLLFITKYYGQPKSRDSIIASVPYTSEGFTPSLFVRAAHELGFRAKHVRQTIKEIDDQTLPALLLMKDGRVLVLLEKLTDSTFKVAVPTALDAIVDYDAQELATGFAGSCLLIKPESRIKTYLDEETGDTFSSWFWGEVFANTHLYAQVVLISFFVNLFALAPPLFIMIVYDRVVPNNSIDTLWLLAFLVVTVVGFDLIFKTLRSYYLDFVGKRLDVVIGVRAFEQVLNIEMAHRPESAGAFASSLKDYDSVKDFMTSATLVVFVDLPFIFMFIFVIWYFTGPLAYVYLAVIPIIVGYGLIAQWPLSKLVKSTSRAAQRKHGVLVETINGLETIKATGGFGRVRHLWEEVSGATAETAQKVKTVSTSVINLSATVQQIASVAVIVVGVHLISQGDLTVGALIATVILGGRALAPLGQLAQLLTRFHQAKVAFQTLNEVMKLPVERPRNKKFVHKPFLDGAIEFENVEFKYPGRDELVVQNLTFSIKPGEKVAFVGRIGSGKSTVAKLVMGLFRPTEGRIRMDGIDLRQIDPVDVRRQIGYVPQEGFLFEGSVKDNITAAVPDAEDSLVIKASELASVDDFVKASESGYDLNVGERGERLSGGQRQTVTLARALIRDPNILVLDEPTSGMDSGTESGLVTKLRGFLKNKTLILVTHRMSLLPLVDRVIILDRGKVVMDGERDKILQLLQERSKALRS